MNLIPLPTDTNRPAFYASIMLQGYTATQANHLSDIFYPKRRTVAPTTRRTQKGNATATKGKKK
jgi:hypothetical protein